VVELAALRRDLGDHRPDFAIHEVERAAQQRAGRRAAGQMPPTRPSDTGSFSAVDTLWKFIPKMAGVPVSMPAAVVVSVDFVDDRVHLVAVVLLGRRVVVGPVFHRPEIRSPGC